MNPIEQFLAELSLVKLAAKTTVQGHTRRVGNRETYVEEHTREVGNHEVIGIPSRSRVVSIPNKPGFWELAIQEHHAKKAGKHYDLRLGDGHDAHSWALRKLPGPGESALAVQQPTHTMEYMDWEGEIPEGYGAGTVKLAERGKVEVVESDDNRVIFNRYEGKKAHEYALLRTGQKNWLLLNRSTTHEKYNYPKFKDKYREVKFGDGVALIPGVMQPKMDGAHALVVLEGGKRPRVFSYRESKRGDILEYTHKIPEFFKNRVPRSVGKVVLRLEILLVDRDGNALPAERTAGVLNSGIMRARDLQSTEGSSLKVFPFDVVGSNKPYSDRFKEVTAYCSLMPFLQVPEHAMDEREKREMLDKIKSGKDKLSKEGVVVWSDKGPVKAKLTTDADVYIRSVFPGEGKYKGIAAGGFTYSRTPDGPILGKVGTGLSDKFRKELWDNRDKVQGRVAVVTYDKEMPSGNLYAPRFLHFHLDKDRGEY